MQCNLAVPIGTLQRDEGLLGDPYSMELLRFRGPRTVYRVLATHATQSAVRWRLQMGFPVLL